jgi:hypothetical protein
VDISAKLAQRALSVSNKNYLESIKTAYLLASGKKINEQNFAVLSKLYQKTVNIYRKDKQKAKTLSGEESPEMAALILVSNTILNLDEVITKS